MLPIAPATPTARKIFPASFLPCKSQKSDQFFPLNFPNTLWIVPDCVESSRFIPQLTASLAGKYIVITLPSSSLLQLPLLNSYLCYCSSHRPQRSQKLLSLADIQTKYKRQVTTNKLLVPGRTHHSFIWGQKPVSFPRFLQCPARGAKQQIMVVFQVLFQISLTSAWRSTGENVCVGMAGVGGKGASPWQCNRKNLSPQI